MSRMTHYELYDSLLAVQITFVNLQLTTMMCESL